MRPHFPTCRDLLSSRAGCSQIDLARGIDAVCRLRIIEFDGYRKIESVHQADVVVVAARCRACESKFGQTCITGPGMLALEKPPQSPVAQDPCPVMSNTHCRRPQNRPPTQGTGTEVLTVALGRSSNPPAEPLNTGTGVPAPATQTVSVQLFFRVNCRVCDTQ